MKLYFKSLAMTLSSRLAYRLDFIFTFASILLWSLATSLFFFLVYSTGAQFPDWTFYEILVFLGLFNMFLGFFNAFSYNFFNEVTNTVREGTLELLLIKPVDEIYLLLSKSFEYESAGEILAGALLFTIGIFHVTAEANFLLLLVYFIAGAMLYFSLVLFISCFAIRFVRVDRLMEILQNFVDAAEYPKNLFPSGVKIMFSLILPLFIFSYYPASAVLGFEVEDPYLVILSCIAFFFIMFAFWKQSIKSYTGAGG